MNKKFSSLTILLLLMMTISCGNDDGSSSSGAQTNPPIESEEGTQTSEPIRWSSIELLTDDPWVDNYTQSLRMDFNQRPIIISGAFRDEPSNESESEIQSCNFQITLTESEANELEKRADRLRLCSEDVSVEEEPTIHGMENTITLTENQGNVESAKKNKLNGFEIDQTWICQGKSSFYSYLKRVVRDDLPAECPDQNLSRF